MRQHKLLYASSYDRGLIHLLRMWPKILAKFPDATLDIAYGWDLFLKGFQNNPERMSWKSKMEELMKQPNITHHGRISKDELNKITSECGIWAYPTDFDEVNCITALNSQSLGCVPCVINKGALKETVGSGVRIEGEIWDPEVREKYLTELLGLMTYPLVWEQEVLKAIEFAKDYQWSTISKQWVKEF